MSLLGIDSSPYKARLGVYVPYTAENERFNS